MKIHEKLSQARDIIKSSPVKKAGRNEFSKYDYFTPEQVSAMVHEAEKQTGLIHLFSMKRNEHGIHGELTIVDIESQEAVNFVQATEIPEIKATNAAQQVGGAVTYTQRYMLMTAFDIADNSLDFDGKDNRQAEERVKPTANVTAIPDHAKMKISDKAFSQLCDKLKANPNQVDRGNLLSKTRRYFLPFTDQQENIIKEITDNL